MNPILHIKKGRRRGKVGQWEGGEDSFSSSSSWGEKDEEGGKVIIFSASNVWLACEQLLGHGGDVFNESVDASIFYLQFRGS